MSNRIGAEETTNHAFDSGQHCSKSDCRSLDLLPLRCPQCLRFYCSSHAPSFYHDCYHAEKDQNFSIDHRNRPSSSSKPFDPVVDLINLHTPKPPDPKNLLKSKSKAQEILDRRFPISTRTSQKVKSEERTGAPQKDFSPSVKLILLKRKAISGDPTKKDSDVHQINRWYGVVNCNFNIQLQSSSLGSEALKIFEHCQESKILWFNKTLVVGRIFDLITETFKSQISSSSSSSSSHGIPNSTRLILIKKAPGVLFEKTEEKEDMIVPLPQNIIEITQDCSKKWGDIVQDGEEIWLASKVV